MAVTIGGAAADGVGILAMPGLAPGILALQVRVPAGAASGEATPIVLRVGTIATAQTATVAIQ